MPLPTIPDPNDHPTNPPENLPDQDAELDPEEIVLPKEEPKIPTTNTNGSSTQQPNRYPDTRKTKPNEPKQGIVENNVMPQVLQQVSDMQRPKAKQPLTKELMESAK